MQVHRDIKGRPNPRTRRQGAAFGSPRNRAAAGSARKNSSRAIERLMVKQNSRHRAATERIRWGRPLAMAAETMRVTARLMPEVDRVTVRAKMEKIS